MRKIVSILLIAAVVVTLGMVSCKKENPESSKSYSELIVGRWKTADGGHYEVYNANGTGHMWDPADDVQEDEATQFDWEIDNNQLIQYIHMEVGPSIPQYCNILILNETRFKYNNDALRAEYDLIRE